MYTFSFIEYNLKFIQVVNTNRRKLRVRLYYLDNVPQVYYKLQSPVSHIIFDFEFHELVFYYFIKEWIQIKHKDRLAVWAGNK